MKSLYKYSIITILIIVFILFFIIFLLHSNGISFFREKINKETPEAKIDTYIKAVAKGDKEEALKVWELSGEQINILKERKENITGELIEKKIMPHFKIIKIEWWRACCASEEKSNPLNASHARAEVEIITRDNIKDLYIFDLYVSNYEYWAFNGYITRHWVLYEVYPSGENPLIWFPGD